MARAATGDTDRGIKVHTQRDRVGGDYDFSQEQWRQTEAEAHNTERVSNDV